MHELSLCDAIAGTVADHANGRIVRRVRLRIGYFRQVVPSTLEFCWDLRTRGTELEGCELTIEAVPAVVACRYCATESTLESPILLCAACGRNGVDLISGEEFLIDSIDVEDPDSDSPPRSTPAAMFEPRAEIR